MKILIIILYLAIAVPAISDSIQSKDFDGQKIQGGAFNTIRSASLGTKGFKCFSTLGRLSWELRVVATSTTNGATIGFKMFYNGNESMTYPISDKFFQWMNSPVARYPNITSVCQRAYSSATPVTGYGIFQ